MSTGCRIQQWGEKNTTKESEHKINHLSPDQEMCPFVLHVSVQRFADTAKVQLIVEARLLANHRLLVTFRRVKQCNKIS